MTNEHEPKGGRTLTFVNLTQRQEIALRKLAARNNLTIQTPQENSDCEQPDAPSEPQSLQSADEEWQTQVSALRPKVDAFLNQSAEAIREGLVRLVKRLQEHPRVVPKANVDLSEIKQAFGQILKRTDTDTIPVESITHRNPNGGPTIFTMKPKPKPLVLTPRVAEAFIEGFNLVGNHTDPREIKHLENNNLISVHALANIRAERAIAEAICNNPDSFAASATN